MGSEVVRGKGMEWEGRERRGNRDGKGTRRRERREREEGKGLMGR